MPQIISHKCVCCIPCTLACSLLLCLPMEVGTPDTAQWLRANRVPEFMNTLIQELLRNKPSQPIDYLLQILAHERSRSNYNYLKVADSLPPILLTLTFSTCRQSS